MRKKTLNSGKKGTIKTEKTDQETSTTIPYVAKDLF